MSIVAYTSSANINPADSCNGKVIGSIRSGAVSPTLHKNIGTAYVEDAFAAPGTALEFAIKDKREPATVCALPFYKRKK